MHTPILTYIHIIPYRQTYRHTDIRNDMNLYAGKLAFLNIKNVWCSSRTYLIRFDMQHSLSYSYNTHTYACTQTNTHTLSRHTWIPIFNNEVQSIYVYIFLHFFLQLLCSFLSILLACVFECVCMCVCLCGYSFGVDSPTAL